MDPHPHKANTRHQREQRGWGDQLSLRPPHPPLASSLAPPSPTPSILSPLLYPGSGSADTLLSPTPQVAHLLLTSLSSGTGIAPTPHHSSPSLPAALSSLSVPPLPSPACPRGLPQPSFPPTLSISPLHQPLPHPHPDCHSHNQLWHCPPIPSAHSPPPPQCGASPAPPPTPPNLPAQLCQFRTLPVPGPPHHTAHPRIGPGPSVSPSLRLSQAPGSPCHASLGPPSVSLATPAPFRCLTKKPAPTRQSPIPQVGLLASSPIPSRPSSLGPAPAPPGPWGPGSLPPRPSPPLRTGWAGLRLQHRRSAGAEGRERGRA